MRSMVPERVASGGAHLHVTSWGDAGPTILALHPGVGDSRVWQWCARDWADAGCRVIAYDRRGFGSTDFVTEEHDDLVDLLTVSKATDARPAVVVGNSLGGGLALDLALAHPDQVTALVLIAPSPSGYRYDDWPTSAAEAVQDDLVAAAEAAGDLDLVNRLEVRYWLDGVDQPEGRVTGRARDLMLEMNGRALRAGPTGASAERVEAWDRLAELSVPVMVVVGEHDLPGIRRQGAEIVDAIPSARLVSLADSAHCPSLDDPAALSRVVLDFLDDVVPGHRSPRRDP